MFIKSLIAAIGLTAALGASAAPIVNGDFESGLAGWTAVGNTFLAGSYGGGFYFGAGSAAQDGHYAIAFNGGDTAPNGTLSQAFATTAGAHYSVNFDFGATQCQFTCGQLLMAAILGADGNTSLASMTAAGQSAGALGQFAFGFVADGSQATLRFSDVPANFTYSIDGVLDNVSVSAVPEPASLALLGLGLFGIGAARRRK